MKKQEIAKMMFVLFVLFLQPFFSQADSSISRSEEYKPFSRDMIFSLSVNDEQTYWGVGNVGLILKTTDGGKTWMKIKEPLVDDYALNGVTFVGDYGWIVGDYGLILHTKDGGNHWVKQVSNTKISLMQVFFRDENRGIAVGEQGTVLQTEDGGSSWQTFPFDWMHLLPESLLLRGVYAPNLYDVFFSDDAHGWIVGDAGIVLSSTDGGKSWRILQGGHFPPLYSLYFKDCLEGWVVGLQGFIAHTKDGGRTWNEQNSSVKTNLFKIRFSGNRGVVVGDLGTILQTTNGGASWDVVDAGLRPPLPFFLNIGFLSGNASGEAICAGRVFLKVNLENEKEKK